MIIDEGGGGQRPDFLFREYGASAVVFHGSRLFGDPYPDSDIDLLVVKESEKKPMARTAEAETLLSRIAAPVPFDVQVWTPEEVRGGVAEGQTYVGIALQNGRYLHGKKERYATEEYFYNIRSWLEEARRHLDYGHLSLEKGSNIGGMDELFQSVERSLKAYLMTKALQVEMTHSLPGLFDQAVGYEPSRESLRKPQEVAYEWGGPATLRPDGRGRSGSLTLAEVEALYGRLAPWLREIDRELVRSAENSDRARSRGDGRYKDAAERERVFSCAI